MNPVITKTRQRGSNLNRALTPTAWPYLHLLTRVTFLELVRMWPITRM